MFFSRRCATLQAVALLVGDGPERAALVQRAEALGVADRCSFSARCTDEELAALYRACDLFVLPSVTRQEAFGVVQLEAMARGKPSSAQSWGLARGGSISTATPDWWCRPETPPTLRDAIAELLANPDRRSAFGAAGIRRVRAVFTADRMIAARCLALSRRHGRG